MSYSYSSSESQTFTLTNAKHIAAKVATDLKRIQRFYGSPSDKQIEDYEVEMTETLKAGYLDTVTYGFQKNGNWIEPTLRYTAKELSSSSATDDDPGKVRPGANIEGASFSSYLSRNSAWSKLSVESQQAFNNKLPFQRVGAEQPGINGYLSSDKTYSSGGRSLDRSSLKSY